MKRCGCVFLALMVFFLLKGCQGLGTAAANSQPTVVKLEEYARLRSSASWVRLTDCELSLLECSFKSNPFDSDLIEELYLPARVPGRRSDKVVVLVATSDSELIELVKKLNKTKSTGEALKQIAESPDKFFQKRDVQGLVRYGVDPRRQG
jgi:hypothetical protein